MVSNWQISIGDEDNQIMTPESPITPFIVFLNFFLDIIYLKNSKINSFFINIKNISKFYSTFSVFVTPELLPPAILPQVLLATPSPTSSFADPEEDHFLSKQGLPVWKLFRSVLHAGLEDSRAAAFYSTLTQYIGH